MEVRPRWKARADSLLAIRQGDIPQGPSAQHQALELSVPIPANPKLRELSNAVNFRVLPQLSAVSPPRGLPGTVVRFLGSGLSPGANVRFADRVFPTTLNAAGAPQVTLPDFDTIGMSAGPLRSILARDHRECRADEICDRGTLTFDCP